MNPCGFQAKTTSYHWAERQRRFPLSIILSLYCITAIYFLGVPHISADVKPAGSHEKGHHLTRLAIFFLDSSLKKEAEKDSGRAMLDLLTVELMQKAGIELVERAQIDQIMAEYSLTLEQMVDPRKAVQIGKMSGADVTIVGKAANNSEKKVIWIKVIDNASGIIKDVGCFSYKKDFADSLKRITEFVWGASITDITIDRKKFIAVGAFEDQSINDMQIDRGDQIRNFLEHKYASDPSISVVARSQMRPLLMEMGLNRMGFTGALRKTNSARPAFTIVDGSYWVIRKSETIYVVNLRIEYLGKTVKQIRIKNASWHNVLQDVGRSIDAYLKSGD